MHTQQAGEGKEEKRFLRDARVSYAAIGIWVMLVIATC